MARPVVIDPNPIGHGSFSAVYKGTLNSKFVAVKRLNLREDGKYFGEASILRQLDHGNIVGYFGIFQNDEGTYDIVLEMGCKVTLAGALYRKQLTTEWKRSTIHQISSGLAYLHAKGVLHLDLKPPNILFKDHDLERVFIADFGMATVGAEARRAGARKFRAPDSPYTQKSDVFSLASIACCILQKRNPGTQQETERIVSEALTQQEIHGNPIWHVALRKGVDADPNIRPTASQFRDAFKLPRFLPPPVEPRLSSFRSQSGRVVLQSASDPAPVRAKFSGVNYDYRGNLSTVERPAWVEPPDVSWWPFGILMVVLAVGFFLFQAASSFSRPDSKSW